MRKGVGVLMGAVAGETSIDSEVVAVCAGGPGSLSVTTKVALPLVVGVPEMTPVVAFISQVSCSIAGVCTAAGRVCRCQKGRVLAQPAGIPRPTACHAAASSE
jgi:hypothetical protein